MHAQSNHGTFQEDMRIGEIKALFFVFRFGWGGAITGSIRCGNALDWSRLRMRVRVVKKPDVAVEEKRSDVRMEDIGCSHGEARHLPDVIDVSISQVAGATTGNSTYAVRQKIYGVSNVGHTANNTFAVCLGFRTRQTRGTRRTTLLPCVDKKDTRQTSTTRKIFESRYTCPIFDVCLRIKPTANPKHSANIWNT